jgi:hypothetical protein
MGLIEQWVMQIGLDQGHAGPATMFFLSHSLGRSKQGRQDAKSTQLLMLVDFALLNSFSFLM